ncbi:hypothetical protein ACFSTC_13095 [Nonomuraea ferruginea]
MSTFTRITPPRVKVGLVAGGLGAYWPQFPDLLPQLQRSAARVSERMGEFDAEIARRRLHLGRPGGRGRGREAQGRRL